MEEATHTSSAAMRPETAAVMKISAGLDRDAASLLNFRGNVWVCKFRAADHSVNARMVSPRGFGVAAGFCVFQLRVQEGTATTALATSHPDSIAESFLNIGDVIVRRHGRAICGRPACDTTPQSLSPAAKPL